MCLKCEEVKKLEGRVLVVAEQEINRSRPLSLLLLLQWCCFLAVSTCISFLPQDTGNTKLEGCPVIYSRTGGKSEIAIQYSKSRAVALARRFKAQSLNLGR